MEEFKNELIIEMINRKQGQVTPEGLVGYALGLRDMYDKIAGDKKASKWISIKDRLPPRQDLILVLHSGALYCVTRYVSNDFPHDCTHWMPLPEPPKD